MFGHDWGFWSVYISLYDRSTYTYIITERFTLFGARNTVARG